MPNSKAKAKHTPRGLDQTFQVVIRYSARYTSKATKELRVVTRIFIYLLFFFFGKLLASLFLLMSTCVLHISLKIKIMRAFIIYIN